MTLIDPINLFSREEVLSRKPIPVDTWVCEPQDAIIKQAKGYIMIPISQIFNKEPGELDCFVVSPKRCYNSDEMRNHITHYLNYFLKYYDCEKELLSIYANIKFLIDYEGGYDKDSFMRDISEYVLSPSIMHKVDLMNRDNYSLEVSNKPGNKTNPALQYGDKHARIFMKCSLLMNIAIPLVTQFIYMKSIEDVNGFILDVFDIIIHQYDMDVYSKLFETSYTSTNRSADTHELLWSKQDIRAKNVTTHSMECVDNIIINIMPKYVYDMNIICLNYNSIDYNSGFQVTNIGYEHDYIPLSGSNRDEDNCSEYDKFESFLIRADEALYIQNKVNCEQTMERICKMFGPFNGDEILYYRQRLGGINGFQKGLVFNLFYKYFGDPESVRAINEEDYIKMVLSAKRLLISHNMFLLAEIISGKVIRVNQRKTLNKKEMDKIIRTNLYDVIKSKYRNPKIVKNILSLAATIISSEFEHIDYYDEEVDKQKIIIISDIICHEILMYMDLI